MNLERNSVEDHLQRRIASFIAPGISARAVGGVPPIALGTSRGPVRTENQDRALILRAEYAEEPKRNYLLGIVSDGLGGMARGEYAAVLTISTFVSRLLRSSKLPASERLTNAVNAANAEVHKQLLGKGGATLSAAIIEMSGRCLGINVGDSRIYAINQSRKLHQISRDDTLAHLLDLNNPHAARNANQLTQFVGIGEGIEPHLLSINHSTATILLTSDGVHGAGEKIVPEAVREADSRSIIDRLLNSSELSGGRDNATAVALPVKYEDRDLIERYPGLTLTLWSPEKTLEIWIPVLTNNSLQSVLTDAAYEMSESPVNVGPKRRKQYGNSNPSRKKGKKRGAARGQKKLFPFEDDEGPTLNIVFPNKKTE